MTSKHPFAGEHLPWFVVKPGESDVLILIAAAALILGAVASGILFLRLHHLPEHIASKSQKVQYEIVAVLGLLAMFTHQNIFFG